MYIHLFTSILTWYFFANRFGYFMEDFMWVISWRYDKRIDSEAKQLKRLKQRLLPNFVLFSINVWVSIMAFSIFYEEVIK